MDRRDAIKKVAAAGVVTWAAPVVLSQGASAMDGTCTPKCQADFSGAEFTATVSAVCANRYDVTAVVTAVPGTIVCPCGGAVEVVPQTFVRSYGRGRRGNIGFNRDFVARCVDRSGDVCESTACIRVRITVTGSADNNCGENQLTLRNVRLCP